MLTYSGIDGSFMCGGSLVSNQWIVTAAHCVKFSLEPSGYAVSIGIHNRFQPDSWSHPDLRVSRVIIHPNYDETLSKNDIAMVKLASPIQLDYSSFKIIPICIPTTSTQFQNRNAYATGWGDTYSGSQQGSDVLREVLLPVLADQTCLNTQYNIDYLTQICAGQIGRDTCQGDSGGPLVSKGSDGRWYLVGITSYGNGCGTEVGVYTRASAFQEWISANVYNY